MLLTVPVSAYTHPGDIDGPSHYFVGIDPENPTGAGPGIFKMLKEYRDDFLHGEQELHIDLSEQKYSTERERTENWTVANFYHVTEIQALDSLTKFQIAVLKAEKELLLQHQLISSH